MMKLGTRYIAVHRLNRNGGEIMVDDHLRLQRDVADLSHTQWSNPTREHVSTVVVDLDSLPPADAPEDEQHEMQFVYHWTRCQELRPNTHPDDAIMGELRRLRAENRRMRDVVDAACAFDDKMESVDTPLRRVSPRGVLHAAVRAYRAQPKDPAPVEPVTYGLTAADADRIRSATLGDQDGSQVARLAIVLRDIADEGKLWWLVQPTSSAPATLAPSQWRALLRLAKEMRANHDVARFISDEWNNIVAAIETLRSTAAQTPRLPSTDLALLREIREYLNADGCSTAWSNTLGHAITMLGGPQ